MRYAAIKYNDIVDCDTGICVSLWMQGCPIRCKGCHNPELFDENGGIEADRDELLKTIIKLITANSIKRNFSVLGGEPLASYNRENTLYMLKGVREAYPDVKIYLWTGYTLEHLKSENDAVINEILDIVNVVIDGPYIEAQRNLKLKLRGSENQRINILR